MVESRSTIRPSHVLPDDNKAGMGKAALCAVRHGAERHSRALYSIHGVHAVIICKTHGDVLGSETRNPILGELGLDTGFFCCGGQTVC